MLKESILTPVDGVDAWIICPPPIYIATCVIDDFPNITKSPGCKLLLLTATPLLYCPADVLLKVIPCCLNTYDVNPEQSNPVLGELPPYTYLYPKYFFAVATIDEPLPDAGTFVVWLTS